MYDFKNIDEDGFSFGELVLFFISGAVRFFGFLLMLFGLWVAVMVMLEALDLYENPKKIEQLASHIERGSNIDANLSSVSLQADEQSTNSNPNAVSNGKTKEIRVSYFFAWFVAILLLLLIARISLGAIKTGGELVLYDVQIKRFAKELAKESFKFQK